MHRTQGIPAWKAVPFFRLLWPFMAGIVLQWYRPFGLSLIVSSALTFFISFILAGFLPISSRYQWRTIQGLFIHFAIMAMGMLVTRMADPTTDENWYGNRYQKGDMLLVSLLEPLTEKISTYKTEVSVNGLVREGRVIPARGKILLYLFKDSITAKLVYGDRLLINKPLQPITNSGNPGAFNYQQYAAFHQLFHRVYLKSSNWKQVQGRSTDYFKGFIFAAREKILSILRKHIPDDKDALGIAEALLIGYTNDLDKDLVQAYSNTGVVHVIAISGMHLALIYLLLRTIFQKLPLIKRSKTAQVILILTCLWMFSFITGASASVLRAAIMFSFMALGKNYFHSSSVFNSLAASAFVLLVYNPYYLWDVGFQLSYLAVTSILMIQQPLYRSFYFKNKWIDKIWQLTSVTLAAQVLTFPVCIYYFHQFPILFLVANLLIVPLSSLVLYLEIGLLAVAWVPFLAKFSGILTTWLIRLMNAFIRYMDQLPYAVWDNIPSGLSSTFFLYASVIFLCYWFLNRNKRLLYYAMFSMLGFTAIRGYAGWQYTFQKKLIVYNVPKYAAIDIVSGRSYHFTGDSILLQDSVLRNFHLRPARIFLQLKTREDSLPGLCRRAFLYQFGPTRFAVIDRSLSFLPNPRKIKTDFIILSHDPDINIGELAMVFDCRLFVFDASNRLWKIEEWLKQCDALHLQGYSIPERGAFISSL